ncbi:Gram-negative porin [Kingella denitrificans ATCC 33394]|uniref:Gram-negative porin n=2 Tax=Kingella denitrificans TaxID=502 RepID=F0F155_9NEIS|nr:Gram-negative porin [Kingella denitrificans ATCC 33394]
MADVILYGQIKGGVEFSKIKDVDGTVTQIVDYGSRIGFKGHEDLGNGLQAIWQLEQKVNIGGGNGSQTITLPGGAGTVNASTASGFGTRDSFIGLRGNFGQVTVGYQHNAIGYTNDKLDIWEYNNEYAGLGVFTRATALNKRSTSVRYVSPDFGGFTVEGSVTPSDNNNGADASNPDTYSNASKSIYSLGLHYKNAGFFADVAGGYANKAATTTNGTKPGHQIVAQVGYDAQPWFAGVAYQNTKRAELADSVFADAKTVNEVAGTVAYNVTEPLRVKASVGYGFGIKEEDGTKLFGNGRYIQGVVGADYALSKRTQANAQVGYVQAGSGDEKFRAGTLSVGLKHKF